MGYIHKHASRFPLQFLILNPRTREFSLHPGLERNIWYFLGIKKICVNLPNLRANFSGRFDRFTQIKERINLKEL